MNRIEKQIGKHVVIHDNDQSGAMLAWRFFHPNTEVPLLIQHIDDRDRWQWKLDGSAELHAALGSMKPWSFEQWKGIHRESDELINEGTAILRAQKQHVASMAKQARKCRIFVVTEGEPCPRCNPTGVFKYSPVKDCACGGLAHLGSRNYFDGLAVNATLHISEVGHELATTSGTFGLVWYLGADNRVKCSLRSNGDYDVSAIARSFGGGGHRNAAGFETDINTLMGWLK